jgi:hypothetical protein
MRFRTPDAPTDCRLHTHVLSKIRHLRGISAGIVVVALSLAIACTADDNVKDQSPTTHATDPPEPDEKLTSDDDLGQPPSIELPETIQPLDCLNEETHQDRVVVTIVDCGGQFDHQVLSVIVMGQTEFVGEEQASSEAAERCETDFNQSPQEITANRMMGFINPDKQLWEAGGRRIICVASPRSG